MDTPYRLDDLLHDLQAIREEAGHENIHYIDTILEDIRY